MRKQISAALAATFLLGAAAVAQAGEGSPDLAQPGFNTGRSGSDPSGTTAAPAYRNNSTIYGYDDRAARPGARYDADTNTGAAVRERLYDEEDGVND